MKGFWGGQAAVSEPQERALSKAPGAGKGEGLLGASLHHLAASSAEADSDCEGISMKGQGQ